MVRLCIRMAKHKSGNRDPGESHKTASMSGGPQLAQQQLLAPGVDNSVGSEAPPPN